MRIISEKTTPDAMSAELLLASRVAGGDDDAATQLLDIALPRVEKTARYLCSEMTEREEVIQNTLIELVKSAGTYRGNSSFLYWVDRVTLHTASRIIRKKIRRRRIQEATYMPVMEPRTIEEELDHRRMQQELALLFDKVSLKEKKALVLHYLYGYSADEIALMTETGVLTVRGRLRSGKKKLKKLVLRNDALADWISVSQ